MGCFVVANADAETAVTEEGLCLLVFRIPPKTPPPDSKPRGRVGSGRHPFCHNTDRQSVAFLQQSPEVTELWRSPVTSVPLTLPESCQSQQTHTTGRDSH
ncbi:putative methylmalonate-semialdehyde dehydrogenase [acylating] mitochondrial [Dissostichus eleginoides]|uniref:Methylmalonate-semialdehyde dehydrogenase [acylating] mitochondrial n=1 Tax=Dissostichus eleginoides TaxID=100907 RepID=A0AAD9F8Q6_DISEL|nr:putative methylmalonate-semialdehyde dehydrogenase [acylating] mitochondrial [Dissostichus eleginoides]